MIDRSHIGLLTVREAAELAGVSRSTIVSWIGRYRLPITEGPRGVTLVSERAVLECERDRRREPRGRKRGAA